MVYGKLILLNKNSLLCRGGDDMKPITDEKDIFKVEMWLVELKSWLECEAMIQPSDVSGVYLQKAKEIQEFLDNR
jgi:hypothetical protein